LRRELKVTVTVAVTVSGNFRAPFNLFVFSCLYVKVRFFFNFRSAVFLFDITSPTRFLQQLDYLGFDPKSTLAVLLHIPAVFQLILVTVNFKHGIFAYIAAGRSFLRFRGLSFLSYGLCENGEDLKIAARGDFIG
jgi:hypothetical protein